ncbi:MAG: hypothetical protein WAN75_26825 [Xanthobacteraceae bacterium]|jgi:hypothetical protein
MSAAGLFKHNPSCKQIDLVTTLADQAVSSGKRYRDCIRRGEIPPVG